VLDRSIFNGIDADGTLGEGVFHTGAASADGGDRVIYDPVTGKIFYDADGSGAVAAVLFAQVNAGTLLTHSDFTAVA
jgi:Ca2+-binding RTX toxin-like protein